MVVTNFANITAAAGDGIRAYNYGNGNVTVIDDAGTITALGGTSPTNGFGVGIGAYNFGTGSISVSTAAGTTIESGSSGISAVNEAPSAPFSSTVIVVAKGTITSGSIPTGNGNPAAGILAGYNFNSSPDNNVAGSLVIDDYASISAASGTDGIRGFNYGTGDIEITAESGAVLSGGRYGSDGGSTCSKHWCGRNFYQQFHRWRDRELGNFLNPGNINSRRCHGQRGYQQLREN